MDVYLIVRLNIQLNFFAREGADSVLLSANTVDRLEEVGWKVGVGGGVLDLHLCGRSLFSGGEGMDAGSWWMRECSAERL